MGFIDTLRLAPGQHLWNPICECGHEDFYHYAGHGGCKCEAKYRHCVTCSCADLPAAGMCRCKRFVLKRRVLSIWAKAPLMERMEKMLMEHPRLGLEALADELGVPLEHAAALRDEVARETVG